MLTIDTNVVTASATGDKESSRCIKEYLSKESNKSAFITPKVANEAFDIGSKLTHQLFLIKQRMEQKDLAFGEAEDDILDDFGHRFDGAYRSLFSNFTDYIADNADTVEEVEEVVREIDRELSLFQHDGRRIRPPKKAVNPDKEDYREKESNIRDDSLVHPKDIPIVMETWTYSKMEGRVVNMITNDRGDFRDDRDKWEEELDFLKVEAPSSFLND